MFVMNVLETVDFDSHELLPGYSIRRANSDEIAFIKTIIPHAGGLFPGFFTPRWECESPVPGHPFRRLPMNEWRYFVIAFSNWDAHKVSLIQTACDIAVRDLEIGFTVMDEFGTVFTHESSRLFSLLQEAHRSNGFLKPLGRADVEGIASLCIALEGHDRGLLDVNELAHRIGSLKALPHSSPLRLLGYFAILESILTHKPERTDAYDSITRQIKQKLKLLDKRWKSPIDYSRFSSIPLETIWSKMYGYRSKLAHGDSPTFQGDFKVLGSHENVLTLVHDTVRALARQALIEPQLLLDLREC